MTIMKIVKYYGTEKVHQYYNIITKDMDISGHTDSAAEVYIYPNSHLDMSTKTIWVKDINNYIICNMDDLIPL